MKNTEAIEYLKEVQSHIDLEAGGYTQECYDAIELAIKTLKGRTMRLGDLDALKKEIDTIKQTAYDSNEEPVDFVELPDLIKVIDNAPTVELRTGGEEE